MISETCARAARTQEHLRATCCLFVFFRAIGYETLKSFAFFLILLANRFNSAYDLVLDTELRFGSRG
jgi:hypothetical protein